MYDILDIKYRGTTPYYLRIIRVVKRFNRVLVKIFIKYYIRYPRKY